MESPISTDRSRASDPPTIAILGADLLAAAAPATQAQLAAAVQRLGFDAVAPCAWGDELIAEATLKHVAAHGEGPVALCSCPFARDSLCGDAELARHCLSLVAPPIAAARYLRALYAGARVRIVYLGDCPSAHDAVIDEVRTVDAVMGELTARRLSPRAQDAPVPPYGHRRFRSMAGGIPHRDALREAGTHELSSPGEGELLAVFRRQVGARESVLVDPAIAVQCACAGFHQPGDGAAARDRLAKAEPQRASGDVLSPTVRPDISRPGTPAARPRAARGAGGGPPRDREVELPAITLHASASERPSRRRRPRTSGMMRAIGGLIPASRTEEGRSLPRAYLGLRGRSSDDSAVASSNGERIVPLGVPVRADERPRTSLGGLVIQLPAIEPYRVPPPPTRQDTILRVIGAFVLAGALVLAVLAWG